MRSAGRLASWAASVAATALAASPIQAGPVEIRGLLDLVAADQGRATILNTQNSGGTVFDAYRLRLFGDAVPDERLAVHTQILYSDVTAVDVVGAYATFTPWPERDLHIEAGKIPWIVGTYAPRTYSNKNPLVGHPLFYQYHTTLTSDDLVPSADILLARGGKGQTGFFDAGDPTLYFGMPIVYDACWDVGAMVIGSSRPLEFAGGLVNGTPAQPGSGRDNNNGKSLLGRIGVAPITGVRFGVSGSFGPYLSNDVEPSLPFGKKAEDYDQIVGMGDLELLYGHAEFRAEGLLNRFETPTVGDLDLRAYYVEGKYSFPVGLYLAARWSRIVFGDIRDSTGASRPWDDTVGRLEYGAGFRVRRDVTAKLVSQTNWIEPNTAGPRQNRHYDVVAAQLSVAF